jgi:hypothetical protein
MSEQVIVDCNFKTSKENLKKFVWKTAGLRIKSVDSFGETEQ